jgi:hypothetical protein
MDRLKIRPLTKQDAAAGFRAYGVEPRSLRFEGADHDEELIWLPLDKAPDSLPKPGLSDRRAP